MDFSYFCFSKRSFLILGTRAEDDLVHLEGISFPILNIENVFHTPIIFHQNGLVFHPEVSVHKADIWTDTKLSEAIFILVK